MKKLTFSKLMGRIAGVLVLACITLALGLLCGVIIEALIKLVTE